jgi:hypothetical protein
LHEPAVTLTAFALAVLCGAFCVLARAWQGGDELVRRWWIVFFASIGLGALLGGIYHGFVPPPHPLSGVVSKGTLLSIGITASACWIVGAAIGSGDRGVVWAMRLAAAQFVAYSAVVFGVTTAFIVAIAAYLPATLFLLAMLILRYRRAPARELALGISGFLLTIVAAAVQAFGVSIHSVYLDRNTLYHLLQGLALYLVYRAARWTTTNPAPVRSTA